MTVITMSSGRNAKMLARRTMTARVVLWRNAAKIIWQRSATGPLRYTVFLGDGDSLAYDAVCSLNVYGDVSVKKEDCIKRVARALEDSLEKFQSFI